MKKLIILIIILILLAFLLAPAFAETSFGLKKGYIIYSEEGDSPYTGNTINDRELTNYGAYLKWVKNGLIVRLDYDKHTTGNTFQSSIAPIPYEEIETTQQDILLYLGREYKGFYVLGGVGMVFNDLYIEGYSANPFTYKTKNGFAQAVIVGYNTKIKGKWRGFLEGRYLWNNMNVNLDYLLTPAEVNITEDMDNFGVFVGVEYNF